MNVKCTMKTVESDYWTGSPKEVIKSINRAISQYLLYYKDVKVGITGRKPQIRFNEHQKDGKWTRMVVKYKTTSERFANTVEKHFIITRPELKNNWLGYSELSEKGDNYLYVVMKNPWKK